MLDAIRKYDWPLPRFDPRLDGLEWFMLETRFKNAVRLSLDVHIESLSVSEKARYLRLLAVLKAAEKFTDRQRTLWRTRDDARRAWEQMVEFTASVEQFERDRRARKAEMALKRMQEAESERWTSGPRRNPSEVSLLQCLHRFRKSFTD